jgi:hypothetical protein
MGVSNVSGRTAVGSLGAGTTQRFNMREQMRRLALADPKQGKEVRRNVRNADSYVRAVPHDPTHDETEGLRQQVEFSLEILEDLAVFLPKTKALIHLGRCALNKNVLESDLKRARKGVERVKNVAHEIAASVGLA